MPIDIRDSDEFDRLLDRLARDIVDGAIFYRLHKDLRASVKGFEQEFNQSRGFWSLTILALLEAARGCLIRVYDQYDSALSLRSWLETIRENLAFFGIGPSADMPDVLNPGARPPDLDQLNRDIAAVTPSKDNALVKKLVALRGNAIAHTNARGIVEQLKLEDRFALTYGDFDVLFERGSKILNRYSDLFKRHTWSTQLVGHDDFKYVLAAIRRDLERHEADIAAEIEHARTNKETERTPPPE